MSKEHLEAVILGRQGGAGCGERERVLVVANNLAALWPLIYSNEDDDQTIALAAHKSKDVKYTDIEALRSDAKELADSLRLRPELGEEKWEELFSSYLN